MEKATWLVEYKRLLTAYNKAANPEQMGIYFDTLRAYPGPCVSAAVTGAIAAAKSWPSAADLVERTRGVLALHDRPLATCDVCNNSTWIEHFCAGVTAPNAQTRPTPVDRSQWCGRDWVHVDHGFVSRCYQCRPSHAAVA